MTKVVAAPPSRIDMALAVAPDTALGLICLYQWVTHATLIDAAKILIIEFVALWSAGVMIHVIARTKSRVIRGIAVLVVVPLAYLIKAYVAMTLLTLNRLTGVLRNTREDDLRGVNDTIRSLILYLFWVFATIFVPLPSLGYPGDPGSKELWDAQPFRALACGAGYFLSQAALKTWAPRWPGLTRQSKYSS